VSLNTFPETDRLFGSCKEFGERETSVRIFGLRRLVKCGARDILEFPAEFVRNSRILFVTVLRELEMVERHVLGGVRKIICLAFEKEHERTVRAKMVIAESQAEMERNRQLI
jgi:hypothetical protein